ncbi:hypothetical protein [Nonomuraea typhae]|uniref:Helix-turn-helix domain-containing protein n=1 Tax=Nonomuraea typhae TaxID=2603600 RepID=A0ABW7YNQ7_9ACTN
MSEWAGFTQGFTRSEVRRWRRAGFGPEEAAAWRAAGVPSPDDARLWGTAGATPETVITWQRGGMTPQEASRWREHGVPAGEAAVRGLLGERPHRVGALGRWAVRLAVPLGELTPGRADALRALLRAGAPVEVARAYADAGWDGGEAGAWALRGVPPAQAELYRAMGFTAAEVRGPAMEVLAAWWGAVPLEEVAAWCAAGLGPEEAAAQRAAGVTAEQAAVLRALQQ